MNVYPVSSNPEYPIRICFTLRLYIILIVERAHTRSRYSRPSKTEMFSHGTWCPDRLRRSTAHTPDYLLPDGLVSPRSLHGICESLSAVSSRFSSRMPPQAVLVIPAVRGGAFRTAEHWLGRTGACVPTTVSGAGEARQDITPFTKTLPLRSIKPPPLSISTPQPYAEYISICSLSVCSQDGRTYPPPRGYTDGIGPSCFIGVPTSKVAVRTVDFSSRDYATNRINDRRW